MARNFKDYEQKNPAPYSPLKLSHTYHLDLEKCLDLTVKTCLRVDSPLMQRIPFFGMSTHLPYLGAKSF